MWPMAGCSMYQLNSRILLSSADFRQNTLFAGISDVRPHRVIIEA